MNRGILFSPGMIKAILGGTKTETRRLSGLKIINESPDDWDFLHLSERADSHFASFKHKKSGLMKTYACPFGKKGDVLHIKETFCQVGDQVVFKSDGSEKLSGGRWAPGWFMPFDIARFFIQNEGVKIERLRDITEEAAVNEGVASVVDKHFGLLYKDYLGNMEGQPETETNFCTVSTAKDSFISLFYDLNDFEVVNRNPWLYALKFHLINWEL